MRAIPDRLSVKVSSGRGTVSRTCTLSLFLPVPSLVTTSVFGLAFVVTNVLSWIVVLLQLY